MFAHIMRTYEDRLSKLPSDGCGCRGASGRTHGIRYPSRKNECVDNFALFSTPEALAAVTISHRYPLLDHPHLFLAILLIRSR
jgi:hypothetical protein